MNDLNGIHALSHTTWNCKYHIVLAPKYRRKVFYGKSLTIKMVTQQFEQCIRHQNYDTLLTL